MTCGVNYKDIDHVVMGPFVIQREDKRARTPGGGFEEDHPGASTKKYFSEQLG